VNSLDVNSKHDAKNEGEKPKRKPFRDWHGATIGLAIGVAGLLASRLGYLWIGFDVIAQFGMQFLLLTLAALIAIAMPRYKGLITSIIFALFIAGYSLWPHWVSSGPLKSDPVSQSEKALHVASFNTYGENKNYSGIAASVLALNADVVTLIEMGGDKAQVLQALKQVYPYQFDCQTFVYCQLAIISKFPLTAEIGNANWEGPPYIRATLQFTTGPITVFGVHTTRFPYARAQFTQVNALVKLVETVTGPVVVMGDFNSTPFSRIHTTIIEGLGFSRLTSLPTWPARMGFPQLAIDHVFVSPGLRAISSERIGDSAGSDHFPISIVLAIPDK
jgi:endonuclease/exonuclease/phosphatase (EEP) superfamily protein YafD